MQNSIASAVIGVICIVLGIFNMNGKISSLHSYHRHRVSEEDKKPFGRMVGLGTLIIGVSLIVFGVLSAIAVYTELGLFSLIGTVVLAIGVAVGIALSFIAMMKYNKGIF